MDKIYFLRDMIENVCKHSYIESLFKKILSEGFKVSIKTIGRKFDNLKNGNIDDIKKFLIKHNNKIESGYIISFLNQIQNEKIDAKQFYEIYIDFHRIYLDAFINFPSR